MSSVRMQNQFTVNTVGVLVVLVYTLGITFLDFTFALVCYDCEGVTCDVGPIYLRHCQREASICVLFKDVTGRALKKGPGHVYKRSCGAGKYPNNATELNCTHYTKNFDKCICRDDLCNGDDSLLELTTTTCIYPPTTTESGEAGSGEDTTPLPGGENGTTPFPGGNNVTTPSPGGNVTTPSPGGNVTTPPPGGNVTTPPPGGNVTTPPPGGNVTTPPPGGNVTTPRPGSTPRPGGNGTTPRPGSTPRPGGNGTTPRPGSTPRPGGNGTTPYPGTTPRPGENATTPCSCTTTPAPVTKPPGPDQQGRSLMAIQGRALGGKPTEEKEEIRKKCNKSKSKSKRNNQAVLKEEEIPGE